jgi:nucleoside 2-deoxyribosyltransferase
LKQHSPKQHFLVYLSGPITGLTYEGAEDWRQFVTTAFPPHIQGISPLRAQRMLEGTGVIHEHEFDHPYLKDACINRRDKFDTLRADAVLVNLLGAQRVSIGTVMEIAWAADHGIPVIVAIEPEGNVHEHAMLRDSFMIRVASLEEAIEATTAVVSPHEDFCWTRIEQVKMLQEEKRISIQHGASNAGSPEYLQ